MKAMNGLLVAMIAGSCASMASAGGNDDVTRAVQLRRPMSKINMIDMSSGGGFGTRVAQQMAYYQNQDDAFVNWTIAPTLGEPIFFEKGGTATVGGSPVAVGPVAAPARLNEFDVAFVTFDGTSSTDHNTSGFTFAIELFSDTIDWMWLANTCAPSGDNSVAQTNFTVYPVGMGLVYIDVPGGATNHSAFGFIGVSVESFYSTGYFNWSVADGNCFVDLRFYTDPTLTAYSAEVNPGYNFAPGLVGGCGPSTANPGTYPALGFSFNNMYLDNNADGKYDRAERFFFGNDNGTEANAWLALYGSDGCEDYDGNGFPNADDAAYIGEVTLTGCSY